MASAIYLTDNLAAKLYPSNVRSFSRRVQTFPVRLNPVKKYLDCIAVDAAKDVP